MCDGNGADDEQDDYISSPFRMQDVKSKTESLLAKHNGPKDSR